MRAIWLLLLAATAADGAELERPKRRIDGAGALMIEGAVLKSAIPAIAAGTAFEGDLWFQPTGGRDYEGGTDIELDGRPLRGVSFRLDAELDPYGEEESIERPPQPDLLLRAAATSDLSLVPMRLLIPHRASFANRKATKQVQCSGGGATVEMEEILTDRMEIDGVYHDLHFTRVLRRFQPSGYQIHDYVLTAEDPDEDFVTAGFALRMLVHPTVEIGGNRPEAGVLLVSRLSATQHTSRWWRGGSGRTLAATDDERRTLEEKFAQHLGNALFERLEDEGIGDPFDSPSAVALRVADLLDAAAVRRLLATARDRPKSLAIVAPLLLDAGARYEPDSYLARWKNEDDPVRRLLLAAGARHGGGADPAFDAELRLALKSTDADVLRAAELLARAMGDPAREQEARRRRGG